MKSHMIVLVLLLNLLMIPVAANAQLTDGKAELTRLRDTYNTESKKLADAEMSALTGAQENYLQTLKKLEDAYQAQGNLDIILAVRTEKERFEKERTLASKNMTTAIPDLLAAQKSYLDMTSKTPLFYARRVLTLITMYDSNLNRLQTQITKEGDIPTAQEIKKERDGMQNLPELVSAKKVVQEAEALAKSTAAATAPVAASNEPPKILGSDKPQKKYTGKPEVQIRKRFKEILALAQDQKWEKAAEYVDPEFTKAMGQSVVTMILRMKFGVLRMAEERVNVDVQIDSITMDDSGLSAVLVPKLVFSNRTREMERLDWAEIDGEWYIKFSQNDIRQQDEEKQNQRDDKLRGPGSWRKK